MTTNLINTPSTYPPALCVHVPLSDIDAGDATRPQESAEDLNALVDSIREHGVLHPIILRRSTRFGSDHLYEVVAGHRRLRAAHLAGLSTIPCTFRSGADARESVLISLAENLQRRDIDAISEAHAYRALQSYGMSVGAIAVRLGKSASAIFNVLRLLSLPESVQARIADGSLSRTHGRALLSGDIDPASIEETAAALLEAPVSAHAFEGSLRCARARPKPRHGRQRAPAARFSVSGAPVIITCVRCGTHEALSVEGDLAGMQQRIAAIRQRHRRCRKPAAAVVDDDADFSRESLPTEEAGPVCV